MRRDWEWKVLVRTWLASMTYGFLLRQKQEVVEIQKYANKLRGQYSSSWQNRLVNKEFLLHDKAAKTLFSLVTKGNLYLGFSGSQWQSAIWSILTRRSKNKSYIINGYWRISTLGKIHRCNCDEQSRGEAIFFGALCLVTLPHPQDVSCLEVQQKRKCYVSTTYNTMKIVYLHRRTLRR